MASTLAAPALATKPNQVCIGRVTSVGDARPSKNNPDTYYVIDIQIEALDAGKNQKVYFTWRPEWLQQYSSADFRRMQEDFPKLLFVYQMNVMTKEEGKQSLLQGLCMTTERFNELASRLTDLGVSNIEANPTIVSDVLRQFFVEENGDTDIGYVLKQQTSWNGEVDENGRKVYEPTKFIEVDKYFEPTDKNIASWVKAAERKPEKYKVTFSR